MFCFCSSSLDGGYWMTPADVGKIALDVLGALHFLHDDLRVMHRDVKPANILLNREGKAKLADLGIVTHPGEVGLDPKKQWKQENFDCR